VFYFYWLLFFVFYLVAPTRLAQRLPAHLHPWLRKIQVGCLSAGLAISLLYVGTLGDWSLHTPFLFGVLLVLGGLATATRQRLAQKLDIGPQLLFYLLGLLGTGFWVSGTSSEVVYQDATATVVLSRHFSLQNDSDYNDIMLYRCYLGLIDQSLGPMSAQQGTMQLTDMFQVTQAPWWHGAQELTLDAETGTAAVTGATGRVKFRFDPRR
jgi:hypothetical protein